MPNLKLYKKIARGGMAEIFLAKQFGDDGFARICCVKRILPHYAQDEEFIRMFRDEAHICKRLTHANIVRVEGFEEVDGSYGIIMEFIDGSDIRSLLSACEKSGVRLSIPMAVHIIAEAARGLHYAHTKIDEISGKSIDIVHRDISPQNILISYEGEVKVTDFGIADAESKASETKPGIVKGKYAYMSPEQIAGKAVDLRTDIFALSIVLWEMLAMKRLFQADTEVQTINMVKSGMLNKDLMLLNPKVDEELRNIVMKGLSKNPKDRYSSAHNFEKELKKYLSLKFSTFTQQDLGKFLQTLLVDRRKSSQESIRAILSDTEGVTREKSRPISLELNEQDSLSVKVLKEETAARLKSSFSTGLQKQHPSLNSKTKLKTSTQFKTQRNKKKKKSFFSTFLLILILTASSAFWAKKYYQNNGSGLIRIESSPSRVMITLNSKPQNNGQYLDSPFIFKNLDYGHYQFIFSREGFADEILNIDLNGNKSILTKQIVMNAINQMAPTKLIIESKIVRDIKVTIDDGIYESLVKQNAETNIDFITFGRSHRIQLESEDGLLLRCHFVPRSRNWAAPFIILARTDEGKCYYPLK